MNQEMQDAPKDPAPLSDDVRKKNEGAGRTGDGESSFAVAIDCYVKGDIDGAKKWAKRAIMDGAYGVEEWAETKGLIL